MFWRERERENKEPNAGPPCGQVRVLVVGDSAVGDWKEESSQPAEPCITPTGSLSGQVSSQVDKRWSTNHDGGISQADQGLDWSHSGVGKTSFVHLIMKGVGKTSFVHLIMKGSSISRPSQTVGCTVSVKHTTYGSSGSSSNSIKGDSERDFFVELWDVSGHERYKDCRSLFYSQINGVIFVYDLSQRKTKTSLQKWAADVAATGTFSAPLGSGGPGGLPVPYIVVGNKADIIAKEGPRGSSGNLVDVARQWVEKQGLLPSSEELPLTESFPGTGSLLAAAKEARYDKEAVMKFFRTLIRRRYFPDEVPASNPWSVTPVQRTIQSSSEILSDDDHFRKTPSLSGDPYNCNVMPPLPAQRNLTPPPTLNPQQPVSMSETYSLPRFSFTGSLDNSNTRSRRMDINV